MPKTLHTLLRFIHLQILTYAAIIATKIRKIRALESYLFNVRYRSKGVVI